MKLAPPEGFKEGDWIQFDAIPGQGTIVSLNGNTVGAVVEHELYKIFRS